MAITWANQPRRLAGLFFLLPTHAKISSYSKITRTTEAVLSTPIKFFFVLTFQFSAIKDQITMAIDAAGGMVIHPSSSCTIPDVILISSLRSNLERAREAKTGAPKSFVVVFRTSHDTSRDNQFRQEGADLILDAPNSPQEAQDAVAKILKKRQEKTPVQLT